MREAIGGSFIFYFVIIFIALFILFFVGGLSYTKAFKVKNKIVDIIENNEGVINNATISEIDEKLGEIGYQINTYRDHCKTDGRFENATELTSGSSQYRYCIYEFKSTSKGNYYGVVAYMYFQVPIINSKLELPVYGETKIFTELSK